MNRKITLMALAFCGFLAPAIAQQHAPMHKEKAVSNASPKKPVHHVKTKANTPIWGAEALNGTADGQFQFSFLNSNSPGSYDPIDWTALTIMDANGTPGNAYWTRTTTGASQGAYWGTETIIASPTQANGAAIFDSDFMDNGGVAGAFGTGASPSPHEGHLISPRIDLTGYTDSIVSLRFWCKWRAFSVNDFSVSFSTDDGTTWSDYSIASILPSSSGNSSEGWVKVYITNQLSGTANLTQCRVRFKFQGDYYFAMVDDLTISTGDAVDLTIAANDPNSAVIADQMYQVQIMNNRHIPISGISDPRDFTYGAVVQNVAGGTSEVWQNAKFHANIFRDVSGTWTQVHADTMDIPSINYLQPGAVLVDTLSSTSWATIGDYRVEYVVSSNFDANHQNDTLIEYFSINDDTYASKVQQDQNGLPVIETQVFPGGTYATFEFGSTFQLDGVGTSNLSLDSISQGFYIPSNYTGPMDVNYTLRFYEWNDVNTDESIDDMSELTLVAMGNDTVWGAGSALGSFIMKSTPMVDVNTMTSGFQMEDNKIYLATVSLVASENGQTTYGSTEMAWVACAESVNYGMNFFSTNTKAHFLHLIDGGGAENLFDQGFGPTRVPAMGLHLSETCLPVAANLNFTDNYLVVDFTDASTTQGDPVDSWSWDFGDGNTSTMQNPNHTYASGGTYEVCLTVTNNCSSDTFCDSVTVAPNTNALSENWMDNLSVYPNPAENVVKIQNLPEGNVVIELRNLLGQVVYNVTIENNVHTEIPVSRLASGHYSLIIQSKSDVAVKRIAIK